MSKTRHIQNQMSKRAIRQEMVDLAVRFGKRSGDKIILNQKGVRALLEELNRVKQVSTKVLERGGIVVVDDDGLQITTYDLDSYKRPRSTRKVRNG